jgi:hypothetical protein
MRDRLAAWLSLLMMLVAPCMLAQDSKHKSLLISVQPGYQSANFSWSIAGNLQGEGPNILSELTWKNVSGPAASMGLQWNAWKQWVIYADVSYASITSGRATDTDYASDDRSDPSFSASLKSNKGQSSAIRAGFGYYMIDKKKTRLLVLGGYGVHRQHLRLMEDGGDPLQPLNSTYQPKWKGPFAGVNATIAVAGGWETGATLFYHQVNYSADANWNLVEDFMHPLSFRHTAKGYGLEAGLHLQRKLNSVLGLRVQANYFQWSTGYGVDELYKSDGQVIRTRLNDASSKGYRIGAGVTIAW